MSKEEYTVDSIKQMGIKITRETGSNIVEDEFGNTLNIDEMIEQADRDLEIKQQANLNLRWNKQQINRLKKIAEARGQKYQSFVKNVLNQVIEAEEKRLGLT